MLNTAIYLLKITKYSVTKKSLVHIVSISFIGGGNWSTQRKPLTSCKSPTLYHIMLYRVHITKGRILIHNFTH